MSWVSRDKIAVAAMQSMIAGGAIRAIAHAEGPENVPHVLAEDAYRIADAMLKAGKAGAA